MTLSSSYPRARPTPEEVAQTKLEGRQQPGWLRSRYMHWPWARPGVAPCGRRTCPVCGTVPIPIQCEAAMKQEPEPK
jgi:hypothetical protein